MGVHGGCPGDGEVEARGPLGLAGQPVYQIHELGPISQNKVESDWRRQPTWTAGHHTQDFTGTWVPAHTCRYKHEVGCCDCVAIREFEKDSDKLRVLKWQNCQGLGIWGREEGGEHQGGRRMASQWGPLDVGRDSESTLGSEYSCRLQRHLFRRVIKSDSCFQRTDHTRGDRQTSWSPLLLLFFCTCFSVLFCHLYAVIPTHSCLWQAMEPYPLVVENSESAYKCSKLDMKGQRHPIWPFSDAGYSCFWSLS